MTGAFTALPTPLKSRCPSPVPRVTNPPLTIQYLGQAGFRISDGDRTLVIDPYLSASVDRLEGFPPGFWRRAYPPPVRAAELTTVDLVLCSHDHLDHADPETLKTIARSSPDCRFGGPWPTIDLLRRLGFAGERMISFDADRPFEWDGITIDPVAAAHEDYETDTQGHHRFLGFILRWPNATLFHAGDTVATHALSTRLARERIDIGFLPVNGADDARRRLGIVGNMDVAAAAALATERGFGLLVPMHYDLYANNGLSDAAFAHAWSNLCPPPTIPLKVFRPGECVSVIRRIVAGDGPT